MCVYVHTYAWARASETKVAQSKFGSDTAENQHASAISSLRRCRRASASHDLRWVERRGEEEPARAPTCPESRYTRKEQRPPLRYLPFGRDAIIPEIVYSPFHGPCPLSLCKRQRTQA
ncbi:hypothetical protein AAFF_G00136830 [Aldrovandia affinis]|uniref:Uncharacterized protein n=1 Tax=Aldrovandia affinis TaxID=143900 RepID=A0AAD7X3I8_9TELE|nr:hypothetical protein AAFF_G00136830 [Aldrovandia affinis]